MLDLNSNEIKVGWGRDTHYNDCYTPDVFFEKQFDTLMFDCAENDRLPFFEEEKSTPVNVLNRNCFTDINKTALEAHSALLGCKENNYIFGADALKLDLSLDKTKNMTPVLVVEKHQFNKLENTFAGEVSVSGEGLGKQKDNLNKKYAELRVDCQFMYNIEQFDEQSQRRLRRAIDKEFSVYKRNDVERKNENAINWETNGNKNKGEVLKVLNDSLLKLDNVEKREICKLVMKHEITQQTGRKNSYYKDPSVLKEAKEKMTSFLNNLKTEMEKNPDMKSNLMEVAYRGTKVANQVISKDISFETKHRKTEHIKAMENLHAIER